MFAIRFLPILTSAYMTFAQQTLADCDFCRSGHMPIAKKSIQTRQMPIDTNAYQTFADHDFCLSGLLRIGYLNGFYWSPCFKKRFVLVKNESCYMSFGEQKSLPQLQNDPIIFILIIYCIFLVISKSLDRQKSDRQKSQ